MSETEELIKQAGDFADSEKPDEAMELCNKVLLNEPDNPGALFVATCVLLQAARHVQALQLAKRLVELCPRDARGWGMQALIYGELHRYDESIRCAERALACKKTAKTLADCAYAYVNGGNWDAGDKFSRDAIQLAAGSDDKVTQTALRDALIHQMYCRLAKKDWKPGFEGFRRTMRTKWRKEWTYEDSKEWMGEPDAVVMVTGEQGLGDEIMAASVVPDAAGACRHFILDCDHRLAALFTRSFPNVIVTPTRREQTVTLPVMPTHHKSLFGLAELFRQSDADFPRQAFLKPDPNLQCMFRELFYRMCGGRRVIGLAWSGGLPRTGMEQRKAGLNAFLPLIRRGDAEFVSLEYKDDREEVRQFEQQHGMRVHRLPWATQAPDMDILAGLISALNEVIGVATTSTHLSSAIGVPTTIIANRGLGWAFAPSEMLWYAKSTQLWRKQSGESWRDCVSRLVEARK